MQVKKAFALPQAYIDFYIQVETWQNQMLFRLKKSGNRDKQDTVGILMNKRRAMIELFGLELDPVLYKDAFSEFAQLVKSQREPLRNELDRIVTALDGLDFKILAEKIINDEQEFLYALARNHHLHQELTYFMLDHALRPFLRHFALPFQESLLQYQDVAWELGTCPVCGFHANYSRVRGEDGKHLLFCEYCFSEWEIPYPDCIYCGNTDQESLRFFMVEGDDAHRVMVCDKCRGYLKTFDERVGQNTIDLFIAGFETIYLDLIAEVEGYSNKSNLDRIFN